MLFGSSKWHRGWKEQIAASNEQHVNGKMISLLLENQTYASFSPLSLVFTGVDSYCIKLWLFDSSCSLFSRTTSGRTAAFSGMFYFFPSYRRLVFSLNTEGLGSTCLQFQHYGRRDLRITASSRLALAVQWALPQNK